MGGHLQREIVVNETKLTLEIVKIGITAKDHLHVRATDQKMEFAEKMLPMS